MKPQPARSAVDIETISPRLLLCAAVLAVALLALFVELLHDSVARGEVWRKSQRNSVLQTPTPLAEAAAAQLR